MSDNPVIGTVERGDLLGLSGHRYIWARCPDCGAQRWAIYEGKSKTSNRHCHGCGFRRWNGKPPARLKPEPGSCVHHWTIAAANGPVSQGTCQKCGEAKDFSNYVFGRGEGGKFGFDRDYLNRPGSSSGDR